MKASLLLGWVLLSTQISANAAIEALALQYRTGEELLQAVQTTLGDEGRVSAYGNQLLINAPEAKIEEIRSLLRQLDTQPRRLLISVDTGDSSFRDAGGHSLNGAIRQHDTQINRGNSQSSTVVRRSTASRTSSTQQVQVSEGYPALIQVGQSLPVVNHNEGIYGRHYVTDYRDVTQGFYVTATLVGDRVQLSISSSHSRLNQTHPGVIDTQQADTQISGAIGEWISIGGSYGQNQATQQGLLQHYNTQGRDDTSLRVKVELLD